jgi:hypothetical protein
LRAQSVCLLAVAVFLAAACSDRPRLSRLPNDPVVLAFGGYGVIAERLAATLKKSGAI